MSRAACWVAVSVVGGSADGSTAAVLLAVVLAAFGIGECIHGAVHARSSAIRRPRLLGHYTALSALSWQLGFAAGPALGGFLLSAQSAGGTWLVWAALCALGAVLWIALEPAIPKTIRRTLVAQAA